MSWENFGKNNNNFSSAQPHCRKLFLTQQKRKASKTIQMIYIIPLKQLFKGRCVGMPQLFIFKMCLTSVMKWILQTGWLRHRGAEATRPQDRPQPCLTEGKLKTSPPYIMCAIFTVITILTLALQLKQWAVGILSAEVPASALTTSKFCFSYQVAMRHGDASWNFYFENFLNLLYTWGGDNTVEGRKTMTLKTYFS